jgi:hypothetical protein
MGGLLEIGRDGIDGPMRAMYSMDPARCVLSGDISHPLTYYPPQGRLAKMREDDYMRVSSMPSTDERFKGLGYCAVSRCLELAKTMIAIYECNNEQLGAKAPTGLLLLNGISQKMWIDAMSARDVDLEGKDAQYFSSVAVLASAAATVEAKLVALRNLPAQFDMREWMDMLMYGYALCFGYDPSEFWPVQFGAIGRGTETEVQHEKATGKGRLDCVLGIQEQLQEQLPDSIELLFDQRDEKGDLLHAEVDAAWAAVTDKLLEKGQITVPESRVLLAEQGVIPRTWAPTPDVESTDLSDADKDAEVVDPNTVKPVDAAPPAEDVTKQQRMMRDVLLSMPRVLSAIDKYPEEPLVEYSYPEHRIRILAQRADELIRPVVHVVPEKKGLWARLFT